MTPKEFVDNIRQELREEGFMSAVKLSGLIVRRAEDLGAPLGCPVSEVMSMLPCEDIKVVEYTNWLTKDYRRKDLFYFIPVT